MLIGHGSLLLVKVVTQQYNARFEYNTAFYDRMARLIAFNKPFRVLSQFTTDGDKSTLAEFIDIPGVYVAGRLDFDSEGLLLLTDDGKLQHRISHPKHKAPKQYLVQVDGEITDEAIGALQRGVQLKDGPAKARVERISEPALWERDPPIRVRKNIPTSWIAMTLKEGRNRQVRRMTAAVGFPTLRLVRDRIGDISLDSLQPGCYRSIDPTSIHL
jgi:23S rRNA pseudouridine2457 synthase